jgi:exodeoxyribonuclease VII large subunit
MARPVKTQWDFGELFQAEQPRKVLSVTQLTWQIRQLLQKEVGQVWVTGEITNFKAQDSGHIYFTLKDAGAQLACVLFRGEAGVNRALLQDGRKVTLSGDVTVYEARGQYQLRVTAVELQGVGALQAAFEKLKQALKAEGLFAQERKRALPRYPQRIGVVTSATGAALRDVLHVVERRHPALEIVLAPCRVQGDGAAGEIAAAIRLLNEWNERGSGRGRATRGGIDGDLFAAAAKLDLILVTRGGGSLEDLWAFNEEVVARAIFDSGLPVVSAVGHEVDFTISDFVADMRAATPSAAAEIVTEGVFASCQFLAEASGRLGQFARQQVVDKRQLLGQATQRLGRLHPRRRLEDWLQRLDDLQTGLLRCARQGARQQRMAWRGLRDRLLRARPALAVKRRRDAFEQAKRRLREECFQGLGGARARLTTLEARLRLLGPDQVLARGYSITMDAQTGAVLRAADQVQPGQELRTRLRAGEVKSKVSGKP